jgi:hypothetical protein
VFTWRDWGTSWKSTVKIAGLQAKIWTQWSKCNEVRYAQWNVKKNILKCVELLFVHVLRINVIILLADKGNKCIQPFLGIHMYLIQSHNKNSTIDTFIIHDLSCGIYNFYSWSFLFRFINCMILKEMNWSMWLLEFICFRWGPRGWCKPSCIPITIILILIVLVVLLPLMEQKEVDHIKSSLISCPQTCRYGQGVFLGYVLLGRCFVTR